MISTHSLMEKKPVVLFADDDADLVNLLQLRLSLDGFIVRTCLNGDGLLDAVLSERPDVILLDVSMNGIDGTDLCKLLKKTKETFHIPVILFSANDGLEDIAISCGADGFIEKPFGISTISRYIMNIVLRKK